MKSEPWYREGLRFKCTECGKCCTGTPGYVWVTVDEIEAIAAFLGISFETMIKKYVRRTGGRLALTEHPTTYDCVFLKDKKCQVYGARPTQCRTFPWWPQNLSSKEAWEETARQCEGISPDAPVTPLEEIEERRLATPT